MPSKTPQGNGKSNGVRKTDSKSKKGSKDGDEEMTVVVPPSKKQTSSKAADADGDVSMGDEEKEPEVDPAEQAIAGTLRHASLF